MKQPINTKIPESMGPILKQIVLELNMSIRQIRHEVHVSHTDTNQFLAKVIREVHMFTPEEITILIGAYDQLRSSDDIVTTMEDVLRTKLLKLLELKRYE